MTVYHPIGIKKYYHQTKRTLANAWLSLCHPTQIAITGSQGKTNTTALLSAVLSKGGSTVATDLTLDTTFNVPNTALKVTPWTKYLIWELGIDHPGEMDQHLEIAKPTIGCITGISPVHTDAEHMGSLEKLIKEKRKLIEILPAQGIAVLNYDDPYVREMKEYTKAAIRWYGSSDICDVSFDHRSIQIDLHGTSATFFINKKPYRIKTGLIGSHHVYTFMAVYLLAKSAGAPNVLQRVMDSAAHFQPLRGRMNIESGPFETIVLNDSLRANPESTRAGLETLNKIKYTNGRKIAVIGEMGELEKPEEEHRKTGEQVAQLKPDFVVGIGPLRKYTIEEAITHGFPREKTAYAANVFEAADILKKLLKKDDLWYLKGSLLRNYKRIVQLLNGEQICCQAMLCPYEHCGY